MITLGYKASRPSQVEFNPDKNNRNATAERERGREGWTTEINSHSESCYVSKRHRLNIVFSLPVSPSNLHAIICLICIRVQDLDG